MILENFIRQTDMQTYTRTAMD